MEVPVAEIKYPVRAEHGVGLFGLVDDAVVDSDNHRICECCIRGMADTVADMLNVAATAKAHLGPRTVLDARVARDGDNLMVMRGDSEILCNCGDAELEESQEYADEIVAALNVAPTPAPVAPVAEPTDDAVEALARVLYETRCRVLLEAGAVSAAPDWDDLSKLERAIWKEVARAAHRAIGGEAAALRSALTDLLDYQAHGLPAASEPGWSGAISAARAALSLPRGEAAAAVERLVVAADAFARSGIRRRHLAWVHEDDPECYEEAKEIQALRAAVAHFTARGGDA